MKRRRCSSDRAPKSSNPEESQEPDVARRSTDREFIAGDYSIADIASYPWTVSHERQNQDLNDFPHLKRWFEAIATRPATVRAYEKGKALNTSPTMSEEAKKILFGQGPETVKS